MLKKSMRIFLSISTFSISFALGPINAAEECLDRANGGNLGLAQAETAVEKLKGKVAQLKRRGEINTTNALALESSLERVRAQIRFFSASDEENSSLGQNP